MTTILLVTAAFIAGVILSPVVKGFIMRLFGYRG